MAALPKNVLKKGDKVRFRGMKKFFTVRCADKRFAICTMPYNLRPGMVIYTIMDVLHGVRGVDNMVFGMHDYVSDEDCEAALEELRSGELEVSSRNRVNIDLTEIIVYYNKQTAEEDETL